MLSITSDKENLFGGGVNPLKERKVLSTPIPSSSNIKRGLTSAPRVKVFGCDSTIPTPSLKPRRALGDVTNTARKPLGEITNTTTKKTNTSFTKPPLIAPTPIPTPSQKLTTKIPAKVIKEDSFDREIETTHSIDYSPLPYVDGFNFDVKRLFFPQAPIAGFGIQGSLPEPSFALTKELLFELEDNFFSLLFGDAEDNEDTTQPLEELFVPKINLDQEEDIIVLPL